MDIHNLADYLSVRCDNFTGADLSALVNTAAMLAARRGNDEVDLIDFKTSLEKMMRSRLERRPPEPDIIPPLQSDDVDRN